MTPKLVCTTSSQDITIPLSAGSLMLMKQLCCYTIIAIIYLRIVVMIQLMRLILQACVPHPVGNLVKKYILYNKAGNDFNDQANWMIKNRYKKEDCEIYKVIYIDDFVDAWNSLVKRKKDINDIYLYLHGGTSCLYFYGETYTVDQMYDDLGELTVHGKVFLNSCNGGTSVDGGGWSVAVTLAMLCPGAYVRAVVNGSVYYRSWKQLIAKKPLTKEDNAYWADFCYVKYYGGYMLAIINKTKNWE